MSVYKVLRHLGFRKRDRIDPDFETHNERLITYLHDRNLLCPTDEANFFRNRKIRNYNTFRFVFLRVWNDFYRKRQSTCCYAFHHNILTLPHELILDELD